MSVENALFGRMQLQHLSITHLIQWGDHLSVEHPGIDAQHKAIFDLGSRIYEHWRAGGAVDNLRPAVDKLVSVIQTHFAYEERLLTSIGYEGLDQHVAEHRAMLADLEIIHDRFHELKDGHDAPGGSLLAPGWSVMQFILSVTIGHVMSSDMLYFQTLVANLEQVQGTA